MAAQGMIRPDRDEFRVVFPYGGQQHEVHSLESSEAADAVLLCLTTWAMADLQRSLDSALSGSVSTPAAMGSPQQLVAELQACVDYWKYLSQDPDADHPAACWLMEAAAAEGHASVVRQLLATQPARALDNLNAASAWNMPLHQAALGGHAAVFLLLLDAVPEAATVICEYSDTIGAVVSEWSLMHSAAVGGSPAVIEALLELHPDAAGWSTAAGCTPLHEACGAGHLEAVQLLLRAAPEEAFTAGSGGRVPLHGAAIEGHTAVMQLLLQAAPATATAASSTGWVPLHSAVHRAHMAAVELLLAAAPDAALMEDEEGERPMHRALGHLHEWISPDIRGPYLSIARLLLPVSGLRPAQLLDALARPGPGAQPLYADLASHFPLSATEWERVPAPCAGLGRALPAVLARSDAEACQLVQRLPATDRRRLRLAALCLGRAQRRRSVFLPALLVRAILAQCLL